MITAIIITAICAGCAIAIRNNYQEHKNENRPKITFWEIIGHIGDLWNFRR